MSATKTTTMTTNGPTVPPPPLPVTDLGGLLQLISSTASHFNPSTSYLQKIFAMKHFFAQE